MRTGYLVVVCAVVFLSVVPPVYAQNTSPTGSSYIEKARVLSVENTTIQPIAGTDTSETSQTLSALVLSGVDTGKIVSVTNEYTPLSSGSVFFLTHAIDASEGIDTYSVLEPDRLPALGILLSIFIVAVVIVGGWTGLRGLLALAISIALVFYVLLPGIIAGYNPVFVALGVAALISIVGSYLTHGLNRTTSAAIIGLLTTIGITAGITHLAIMATQLTGVADESSVDLNFATQGHINFLGLLFAAMLIGALGILYDAAISQAVAVDELLHANSTMPLWRLFTRAMRIGREHIGALVNTLAIAYVGVSLPLLLLFKSYASQPFLLTINTELFATEIVRALVGSLGIILAIPISTAMAIVLLKLFPSSRSIVEGNAHTH